MIATGIAATMFTAFTYAKTIHTNQRLRKWRKWAAIGLLVLGVAAFWGVMVLFWGRPWAFDIHANEYLARMFFVLAMVVGGYDLMSIACSNYPGLLFHKGLVNKGNGLKMFDNRTDDPTGKTFGMKIFGRSIKVPRTTWKTRIVFAIVSVVVFALTYKKTFYV